MLLCKLIHKGPGIFLNQTISDGLKVKIVVFGFFSHLTQNMKYTFSVETMPICEKLLLFSLQ